MAVTQSNHIRAPKFGQIYARIFIQAGEVLKTPTSWKGRRVTFCAEDSDLWIAVGPDSSMAITKTAVSGTDVNGNIAPAPGAAVRSGVSTQSTVHYTFLPTDDYFVIAGSNGTGFWQAWVSDIGGVPV